MNVNVARLILRLKFWLWVERSPFDYIPWLGRVATRRIEARTQQLQDQPSQVCVWLKKQNYWRLHYDPDSETGDISLRQPGKHLGGSVRRLNGQLQVGKFAVCGQGQLVIRREGVVYTGPARDIRFVSNSS